MADNMFPHLFSPVKIGAIEVKNRIAHSPHGTASEDANGFVADRGANYNIERARGGMGLIFFGDVSIESGDSVSVSLAKSIYIPKLRDMTDEIHFWGARVFAHLHYSSSDPIFQIWKFETGGQTEAIPTVSGISPEEGMPARQMTLKEIEEIQNAYADAAYRAKLAGFDGVSINGAYGFLPAQFISGSTNKRTDKYGGDIQGRSRFIAEIVHKIRSKTNATFPVILKISGDELRNDGLKLAETVEAAKVLEKEGVSAFFVVGGTQSKKDMHRTIPPMGTVPFGCFVPYAEAVKKAVSVPVIVGTRINDPTMAEEIIRDGKADIVAVARASLADPEWAKKAQAGSADDIRKCIYCNRCLQSIWPIYAHHLRCSVNSAVYREKEYRLRQAERPKRVLIAGGGPAGMETARVATLRGHKVLLCEKSSTLGGQLLLASKCPHKEEIANFTSYLTKQMAKLGIEIKLNTEVTANLIKRIKPDVLIIATGAEALVPDIPGIHSKNVVTAWDILEGKAQTGQKVIVAGGGMVGCEIAEYFVSQNKEVTIVEMMDDIALDMEPMSRMHMMERYAKYLITIRCNSKVIEVVESGIRIQSNDGKLDNLIADTIVLALGAIANNRLEKALHNEVSEIYTIGDCKKPYRILEAVHDASYIAREL